MTATLTNSIVLDFFLVSLAVWRVSSLFAREDGLFDVFIRFRGRLGVKELGTDNEYGESWLSKGILCVWCSSIWFSAIGAFMLASDNWTLFAVYLLSLSTMAIIIEKVIKG